MPLTARVLRPEGGALANFPGPPDWSAGARPNIVSWERLGAWWRNLFYFMNVHAIHLSMQLFFVCNLYTIQDVLFIAFFTDCMHDSLFGSRFIILQDIFIVFVFDQFNRVGTKLQFVILSFQVGSVIDNVVISSSTQALQ